MKNIVIPILGAVSIVSTGAVAWLLASPPSVDPRLAKLESELKEARQTIAKLQGDLNKKSAATNLPITSTGNLTLNPTTPPTGASAAAGGPQNLSQVYSTPAMREVIDKQQAAQIEVGYAQLFEQLRLTPEEREHLKTLLTSRQKVLTDFNVQLLDPNLSPERRSQLINEARNQHSLYEATLKKFFNDDNDWNTFAHWENTQPERTQFNTVGRSLFNASSEPLSQTQEQQLIDLMAQVRMSPDSVGGINDQTGTDPNKLTDEVIARQLQQIETNQRLITERSQAFLTPAQQVTLQSYLTQMQAMAKSGIEMSKILLRGSNQ